MNDRTCVICGNTFKCYPIQDRRNIGGIRRFCSRACQTASRTGTGNPKWRGGTYDASSGYIYQYAPQHPNATKGGYVMQHRLVMEAHLCRFLTRSEQVHHVNHVRNDNRIENLELMVDSASHRRHHAHYAPVPCGWCGTEILRSLLRRTRFENAFCSRRCAALNGSARNAQKAAERCA